MPSKPPTDTPKQSQITPNGDVHSDLPDVANTAMAALNRDLTEIGRQFALLRQAAQRAHDHLTQQGEYRHPSGVMAELADVLRQTAN